MSRPASSRAFITAITAATLIFVFELFIAAPIGARDIKPPAPAPEFTQREASAWINSQPLMLKALRGQVVLLGFWTFDCWNC
jgi:hypothetical protein